MILIWTEICCSQQNFFSQRGNPHTHMQIHYLFVQITGYTNNLLYVKKFIAQQFNPNNNFHCLPMAFLWKIFNLQTICTILHQAFTRYNICFDKNIYIFFKILKYLFMLIQKKILVPYLFKPWCQHQVEVCCILI